MKIMKVVYMQECVYGYGETAHNAMGEESWNVGEEFKGEFVRGEVHTIQLNEDGSVTIFVLPENGDPRSIATWIAPHAVQRIYYGEH